jgi:hypothetical protein
VPLGSPLGRTSSTSTTPSIQVPRLLARLVVDYFDYVVRSGASAPRAARRRLFRLCCATKCLGSSRGSSSTTSVVPCVSYWLNLDFSSVGRTGYDVCLVITSHGSTTRRSVAPALLRLCLAFGRTVSPLDFLSVGRTSSRCARSHWISQLDYLSSSCTGSTAPMLCIRIRHLAARQLDSGRINSLHRQQS